MRFSSFSSRPAVLLLVAVASATGACAKAEVVDSSVIRSDSSGVRIVVSTATDTVLPWTFEDVGTLADSAGSPYIFANLLPDGVLVDRGGRVYVLTRDPSVLRFGRGLMLDRTLGRKGGGPGEMQAPNAVGSHADTLFVHDVAKRALVRWGPDLQPMGDRRLDGALAGTGGIAFRTGGFWFQREHFSDSLISMQLLADTLGAAPILQVDRAPGGVADFGCILLTGQPRLFTPALHWSALGPRMIASASAEYVISMYEGARLIARVRRSVASRAPTVEDARALYPTGMRVLFTGGACEVPTERVVEKLGMAAVFPAVHNLRLLSDGTIWVQRTPGEAAESVLDVFSADGAYVGTKRGMPLPLASMPGGDLLVSRDDPDTGGQRIVRVKVSK